MRFPDIRSNVGLIALAVGSDGPVSGFLDKIFS